MAVKKKPAKKVQDPPPNPGDYLDNREVQKYGPRVVGGEANYMPGDMSKAYRTYQEVGGGVRSSLEFIKEFMGGGLRKQGK